MSLYIICTGGIGLLEIGGRIPSKDFVIALVYNGQRLRLFSRFMVFPENYHRGLNFNCEIL